MVMEVAFSESHGWTYAEVVLDLLRGELVDVFTHAIRRA